MLHIDARFMKADGSGGVGRWRKYYDAADLDEAAWAARNLVPGCQVRVREGRATVHGPCLARHLAALYGRSVG